MLPAAQRPRAWPSGNGVSTAACGSLVAIVYGAPPHYSFCVYQGVDAGALVGAQRVTDFPELCNNTSEVITAGQVPAACNNNSAIYLQLGVADSGSVTVLCDDGGVHRDAAAATTAPVSCEGPPSKAAASCSRRYRAPLGRDGHRWHKMRGQESRHVAELAMAKLLLTESRRAGHPGCGALIRRRCFSEYGGSREKDSRMPARTRG